MKSASLLLALLILRPASAQLQTITVTAPTRLDWAFAVRGFGPDAAKLPAGFDSTKQKYQLFVPANYKPKQKAWPLVAFISPSDGPSGWANFKKVCEAEGMLFCSPMAAGNSVPAGQRTRIILDMIDDVRRNYDIDPEQTYLGGFSGGGRMACAIGFSLPEVFAGVIPVCGTNPISPPDYLRHRMQDRMSVAFITGETDMNRKENEVYMAPWLDDIKVRTKLWIVPKMGHAIPSGEVLSEVVAWLKEDLKRRQADSQARPKLALKPDEAPDAADHAKRLVETAESEMKQPERIWRAIVLYQGVTQRFPKTDTAKEARERLGKLQNDEKVLEAVEKQGAIDQFTSVSAQARALERFGNKAKALEAWRLLSEHLEGSEYGKKAAAEVKRLKSSP